MKEPSFRFNEELFLPRKQDVVIWDQRCWHRATKAHQALTACLGIFGFYPVIF